MPEGERGRGKWEEGLWLIPLSGDQGTWVRWRLMIAVGSACDVPSSVSVETPPEAYG